MKSNSPIVNFYYDKINDIFSSFFIKYFTKQKEKYQTINTEQLENEKYNSFKKFLLSKNPEDLNKSFTSFDIYINKKYNLDYSTLNTTLYIFTKEFIEEIIMEKIAYTKTDKLKHFYFTCYKKIACHLYENNDDSYLESKKIIIDTVKNTIHELIPIDFVTRHYNETIKKHEQKLEDKQHLENKHEQNHYIHSSIQLHSDEKNNSSGGKSTSKSTIKPTKTSSHSSSSKRSSKHKSNKSNKSNIESSDIDYNQYYKSDSYDSSDESKKSSNDSKKYNKDKYKDEDEYKKIKLDKPL